MCKKAKCNDEQQFVSEALNQKTSGSLLIFNEPRSFSKRRGEKIQKWEQWNVMINVDEY